MLTIPALCCMVYRSRKGGINGSRAGHKSHRAIGGPEAGLESEGADAPPVVPGRPADPAVLDTLLGGVEDGEIDGVQIPLGDNRNYNNGKRGRPIPAICASGQHRTESCS